MKKGTHRKLFKAINNDIEQQLPLVETGTYLKIHVDQKTKFHSH